MEFKQYLNAQTVKIDEILKEYLPEEKGFQKTIFESMNYSILAGGKRIRPLIMLETYRLYQGKSREIEPFMAAMEMIHTSSLVHDDLPCMDNDEFRRGRETTWKVYGEDMATLAGDALILYAFEMASKAFDLSEEPLRVGKAMRILAGKSGIYGMVGGQTVDLEMTGKPLSMEQLMFIYRLKTGALLEASMMIGAVLGGACEEELKAVEQIASDVGLAFQIQDDILDVTGTTEALGKTAFSDEKNQKTTYVTLAGLEKSKDEVALLSQRAVDGVNKLSGTNEALNQLIAYLITRIN